MKCQLASSFLFTFIITNIASAQSRLEYYYRSVNESCSSLLRLTLHDVIDDHKRYSQRGSRPNTWEILENAEQDPNNPANILDIYKNASYCKAGGGNNYYDREHVWPSAYGFPKDSKRNMPYTDCHQLHLTNSAYNNARGNKPFDFCDASCQEFPTIGGANREYPSDSNWVSESKNTWESWSHRKGDIARTMFYMDIRYEGGTHNVTGVSEPDLRLTDHRSLIVSTQHNRSVAYMGLLSVLISWHKSDPVDDLERERNEVVYSYQGNRNPFIDHPEWVNCIYENDCENVPIESADGTPWINEIHYDNKGLDTDEGIELAGTYGLKLDGWKIVCYNGQNSQVYATIRLSGQFENQQNGFGALWFDVPGLQNGSSDGIALVNPLGQVIEFLSYEGMIVANDGPADGMMSVNIGVSENSATPIGASLQRVESGHWVEADMHSRGQVNVGQEFE